MRKMSSSGCGSPVGGGGFVRQRHSAGYASSGDDLDDDATSRFSLASPPPPRTRTWTEVVEYILWIASAAFIVYFGDQHSNLIYLLWHDGRIKRIPLYLGMVAVGLNIVIFLYTSIIAWGSRRFDEKWELVSISTLPYVTLLGIIAFCLLSFAVWPIWSFLALPLLFTLFMACMVVFPCIMISILRPQTDVLRVD